MSDMLGVIEPKSDQINAEDLIAGDRIITITGVQVRSGTEQPVSMKFAGSEKVFRPCKTVSRIIVKAWGADSAAYVGRSMQLYCDPDVTWAGLKVGGIRVRAMSHIDGPLSLALAESKKARKITTVKPLKIEPAATASPAAAKQSADDWTNTFIGRVNDAGDLEALAILQNKSQGALTKLDATEPGLAELARSAIARRLNELSGEGPGDSQRGEQLFGEQAA